MLLHICHPDNRPMTPENTQVIASSHPSDLSERELEILALLADKVRTKDIATTLNISIRTVRTHIQHVMYKLQVHKRNEAIKAGKRLKLI
jgi:LuxR family maltose regulon positive regulatory protein